MDPSMKSHSWISKLRSQRRLELKRRSMQVSAICLISAGVCSPARGVPGSRYLPIASPPTSTGSRGPDTVDEAFQLLRMTRRKHHLAAGLGPQCPKRTALSPGADHADPERRGLLRQNRQRRDRGRHRGSDKTEHVAAAHLDKRSFVHYRLLGKLRFQCQSSTRLPAANIRCDWPTPKMTSHIPYSHKRIGKRPSACVPPSHGRTWDR